MASSVTIAQITDSLRALSAQELDAVYEFVMHLSARKRAIKESRAESYQTMLASEAVLAGDWDRPEEDAAWADL